jgi:hypothetical protein
MTPKEIAKKLFENFRKVIDEENVSDDTIDDDVVTLNIIKNMPKGDKARFYYDKLCNDYLYRIGYFKKYIK